MPEEGETVNFEPLHYEDRLRIVNPVGDVGIVTLWSKVDSVYGVLASSGVDLAPETSRVAVMANLYGNGLPHMLRNLLYNPQIEHLLICGKNLSGSREWLLNFFERGLEEVDFLGTRVFRIVGTDRVIDGEVRPENFAGSPSFGVFGDISDPATKDGIREYLESLESQTERGFKRVTPPGIPEPEVTRFPSHPGIHLIHRATPIEAWRELVFRLYRFGHRNTVKKSTTTEERVELLNVHVVVDDIREESDEALSSVGFSLSKFRAYQERIIDPDKPSDLKYTYGWLLRTGMEGEAVDSLQIIADRLRKDPDSRHTFATLWNNGKHLPNGKSCPCFVTLFFRRFEGKLTMTATFRAHNAMDAWLENFYGLVAIQRFVTVATGLEAGSITVISHSISIDPASLDRAKRIADERKSDDDVDRDTSKHELRFDSHGAFSITFDRDTWELVVEHTYQGQKLAEYRGRTPEQIETALMRDLAISLPSHALYVGRQLARKEQEMKLAKAKAE